MRFKPLLIGLALCSLSVQAENLDVWASQLKHEMESNYSLLNQRVSECKSIRKDFDYSKALDTEWYIKLNQSEKRTVIQYGFAYASQQCSLKERQAYTNSLMNYVAYSGDKKPLNEWLSILEGDKDLQQKVNQIGIEDTQTFIASYLSTPFDALRLLKVQGLF
ncbi:hypothetical protein GCM10007938_34570 [Vibrio zhanjiangensis]|uniref:Uncharacterized protein n=1 Tax=Vibrio zhanjiangensis TaxID=1046128 RepID=A0ABQ6F2G9_9VIBR|nr:hypothetical protein [Vibrio zhanjiangensis]GLT19675.1 hypothetical protein GCM10007938_34570 [Vibrio zhanjiangensis]